jgi:hypothetical protein
LGLDGEPNRTIRVYRPPEEVFATDSMASYAHKPVTMSHPNEMVDAANWADHAKGQTGGEVIRDGQFVRVPMLLMDAAAINEWKEGTRELSMGYTMDLEVKDGVTPEGESFNATQRNLRMNHLALVPHARGGSQLRLGDVSSEDSDMSDVKLTTVTVDGLSVQTTDAGAQAISKLSTDVADARKAQADAEKAHAEKLAAKDKELAAKDAEIDSLKGKVLSDEALDAKVKDRADLITKAKAIADKDYTGKTADQIRSAAVVAKLGPEAVKDKSAEYVAARFDILAEDADQDPVRRVLRSGDVHSSSDAVDKAHAGMVTNLQDAWKSKAVQ